MGIDMVIVEDHDLDYRIVSWCLNKHTTRQLHDFGKGLDVKDMTSYGKTLEQ